MSIVPSVYIINMFSLYFIIVRVLDALLIPLVFDLRRVYEVGPVCRNRNIYHLTRYCSAVHSRCLAVLGFSKTGSSVIWANYLLVAHFSRVNVLDATSSSQESTKSFRIGPATRSRA